VTGGKSAEGERVEDGSVVATKLTYYPCLSHRLADMRPHSALGRSGVWLSIYLLCVVFVCSFILFEVLDVDGSDFPTGQAPTAVRAAESPTTRSSARCSRRRQTCTSLSWRQRSRTASLSRSIPSRSGRRRSSRPARAGTSWRAPRWATSLPPPDRSPRVAPIVGRNLWSGLSPGDGGPSRRSPSRHP